MASDLPSGPDPTLYLYTSLTAGSSHIITATSRLETILKANKIAFRAIDCATDEKARNLWSRKSKGRKIPGLVKYGVVIGDLNEVEEWNEYGEMHENIDNVSDLFGDTPMTDTPMPPPAPITIQNPLAKIQEPPFRSSSETRHISISEPKEKEGSPIAAKGLREDNPMSMALRQAGVEAAAKAGQRKAASTASALPAKQDPSETTPTASAAKMSIEATEPAKDPTVTAAKAPAQLAAEGAKKTSVDKITGSTGADSPSTSDTESEKSNEEQVLEARRASSIAKAPSRLAQETSVTDLKASVPEQAATSEANLLETAPKAGEVQPSHHRGSSLSEASKQEITNIEARNAIQEEPEEESTKDKSTKSEESTSKPTIQATDEAEIEATKGIKPQDQKAKDANAAGVSAAVAMFLSPNHDPNPKRLSADSASVYSFFDSAFSPAPLFSGAKTLDLNMSFVQDIGKSDPRASVSTYGSKYEEDDEVDDTQTADEVPQDATPKQSEETQRSIPQQQTNPGSPEGSPRREILHTMPVIAPLRTPARRLASEPLHSHPVSPPSSSIPLPLNIRKSPTDPSLSPSSSTRTQTPTQSPPPSRSQTQPHLQTSLHSRPSTSSKSHHHTPSASGSSSASPITPLTNAQPNSPTPSTPISDASSSRALRFKKSLASLRSKKSSSKLNSSPSSPPKTPPNLPAQRHLRDLGVNFGGRTVSDGQGKGQLGTKQRERERGKLLCF